MYTVPLSGDRKNNRGCRMSFFQAWMVLKITRGLPLAEHPLKLDISVTVIAIPDRLLSGSARFRFV